MVHYRYNAVLPTPAMPYMLERDSAAFRQLLCKSLNLGELEVIDTWTEGGSTFVKTVTRPDLGNWVPSAFKASLSGDKLAFHDIIEYNPQQLRNSPYVLKVRSTLPFFKKKAKIENTLTIEEIDSCSCRQTLEGEVSIPVAGIGKIIERVVKDSLDKTYKSLPQVLGRWMEVRQELIKQKGLEALTAGRPDIPIGTAPLAGVDATITARPVLAKVSLGKQSSLAAVPEDHAADVQLAADAAAKAAGAEALADAPLAAPLHRLIGTGDRTESCSIYYDAEANWHDIPLDRIVAELEEEDTFAVHAPSMPTDAMPEPSAPVVQLPQSAPLHVLELDEAGQPIPALYQTPTGSRIKAAHKRYPSLEEAKLRMESIASKTKTGGKKLFSFVKKVAA